MKKTVFLIFICTVMVLGQNNYHKSIGIGAFIGEGSGLFIEKSVGGSVWLQWNLGIHEWFVKYNYIDKYRRERINQSYSGIYSSFIGIVYIKTIKEHSPVAYRLNLGGQFRVIPRYAYQISLTELPPNLIIIDDPITKTKIDFGINYFIGIGYKLNNRINIFTDIGGYSEITDKFLWTNPQVKIGIRYLFMKKIKNR